MNSPAQFARHQDPGLRFAFGRSWKPFLATLDEHGFGEARRRLCELLERNALHGIRTLDIGSGKGLSSLVMHLLDADVMAFDYDNEIVSSKSTTTHGK